MHAACSALSNGACPTPLAGPRLGVSAPEALPRGSGGPTFSMLSTITPFSSSTSPRTRPTVSALQGGGAAVAVGGRGGDDTSPGRTASEHDGLPIRPLQPPQPWHATPRQPRAPPPTPPPTAGRC